jgi:ABC-type Na+ efflux pump permease subunit
MYNESMLNNVTTIWDIYSAANQSTTYPYLLSIVILLIIWVIFFIIPVIPWGWERAFTFSSFISIFSSAFLWILEELPGEYLIIPLILFLIGIFVLITGSK